MLNPMDLSGSTILVTGASSGIGRETAILLSRLGARLILVSRTEEKLLQTASMLEGAGHQVAPFDLKAVDDIPGWLKQLTKDVGLLNGLVHSAGVQITRPLRYLRNDDVEQVMRINFNASIGLAKAFRQKDVCHSDGSIVFLSSIVGLVGQPGIAAYAASKGALIALTRSLAVELARERIRVNCVAPAVVRTEMAEQLWQSLTPEQVSQIALMHPLGIGEPIDIAYAIAFLLAETGRWITGTTLIVDGGYTAH